MARNLFLNALFSSLCKGLFSFCPFKTLHFIRRSANFAREHPIFKIIDSLLGGPLNHAFIVTEFCQTLLNNRLKTYMFTKFWPK